jgi:exonuclease SbcC
VLKSIEYTVQFASTGRTLHEQIRFDRGFGAIVGPNESGKSMVLEMVRWILFGSSALRGSASDYTKVHGALAFTVKGDDYFATRSNNGATLKRGDVEIATGTKPVNLKVVETLGYGLPVFDIANVANQNDLLALGQMPAAQRKRLVDSVIGLGVIDDLAKLAGDEANALKRRASDLAGALAAPVEPVPPDFYEPSTVLATRVQELVTYKSQWDQLMGWLSVEKPKVQRPETDVALPAAELEQFVETQNKVKARVAELEKMPKPRYTLLELAELKRQNLGYENAKRLKGLESRLVHLEKEQMKCPECGHQWSLDQKTIDQLKGEIHMLKAVNIFSDKPAELPDLYLDKEIDKVHAYNADHDAELAELKKTLAKQPDFRDMLVKRQRYELALERYDAEMQSYDEWRRDYDRKLTQANELELLFAELPSLQNKYEQARDYESHQAFYAKVKKEYDERLALAETVRAESEDWTRARTALATLRSKVKQHLVPSLNKVASHLLKEMTSGQRQSVVIDEDFEITVDGQPLRTLSGSGMAVANLAIRIGLGQVLTRNIMNVFMADEIDASMDKIRSDSTAQALQNLRSTITQILLVTHKSPEADYYINLGKDYE